MVMLKLVYQRINPMKNPTKNPIKPCISLIYFGDFHGFSWAMVTYRCSRPPLYSPRPCWKRIARAGRSASAASVFSSVFFWFGGFHRGTLNLKMVIFYIAMLANPKNWMISGSPMTLRNSQMGMSQNPFGEVMMGLAHVSIDKNDCKMMGLYITSDHWVQLGWFFICRQLAWLHATQCSDVESV